MLRVRAPSLSPFFFAVMGGEIHALLLRGFSHGRTAHSFACSFAKPEFPTPIIGKNARVCALLLRGFSHGRTAHSFAGEAREGAARQPTTPPRHDAAAKPEFPTPLIGKNARVCALLFLWQRHHAAPRPLSAKMREYMPCFGVAVPCRRRLERA